MKTCPRPIYIAGRLTRRFMPSWLVNKIISCEKMPADRIAEIFKNYLEIANNHLQNIGTTHLEFGCGTYNPAAIGFLGFGARKVYLLDPFSAPPSPEKFSKHMEKLCAVVRECGGTLDADDIFTVSDNKVIFNSEKICSVGLKNGRWDIPENSIDTIFSSSVMEHVRDIDALATEIYRVLSPGGSSVNTIHLADHWHRFPLDMLKYSRFMWEKVLTTQKGGGGYQNRLRLSQFQKTFAQAGMTVSCPEKKTEWDLLKQIKPQLHRDFNNFTDDDLAVLSASIIVTKNITVNIRP